MVADSVLRDHGPPVRNIRVVSERQDSGPGDLLREECGGPCSLSAWSGPGFVAVASEAVDEDDACEGSLISGSAFGDVGGKRRRERTRRWHWRAGGGVLAPRGMSSLELWREVCRWRTISPFGGARTREALSRWCRSRWWTRQDEGAGPLKIDHAEFASFAFSKRSRD